MNYEQQTESLKNSFAATLARIVGCAPNELPAAISKKDTATFLELKNPKTLDVWKSTKRYPLVYIKVGRHNKIGTDSLIQLMVSRAEIPEVGGAA